MRRLSFLVFAFLLLPALDVASAPSASRHLSVVRASFANYKTGSKVPAGRAFVTERGGFGTLDYKHGGINEILLSPKSSVTLKATGDTANGGRFTKLQITGEVNISVTTVNPFSEVHVCFKNRIGREGCGQLRSSARIAPTESGVVVATKEGEVTLSTEFSESKKVVTNHYSVFKEDGTFTDPANAFKVRGYQVRGDSKGGRNHTVEYVASEGWRFADCSTRMRGIVGQSPSMLNPLQSCSAASDSESL